MTIPNILTLLRIALVPLFVKISLSDLLNKYILLFVILLFSGITDVLDGFIARKFNMKSKLGTLLDPIADKLLQISVFICLSAEKIIPFWLVLLILIKELLMVVGAALLLKFKKIISSDYSGKIATMIFYLSSFVFILLEPSPFVKNAIIAVIVLSVIYAFVNYSAIFYKTLVKENDRNVQTYKH